jgi:hypothetical protein
LEQRFLKAFVISNLILAILCLISYAVIINELIYWTNWNGPSEEIGGVLNYIPFWRITINHVTPVDLSTVNNIDGELFSIPDFTAFLLIAVVILNTIFLIKSKKEPGLSTTRDLSVCNLFFALFSFVFYEWWTMFGLAGFLNGLSGVGGIVIYVFPTILTAGRVVNGQLESSGNTGPFPDLTLYFIFILLFFASITIVKTKETKRH